MRSFKRSTMQVCGPLLLLLAAGTALAQEAAAPAPASGGPSPHSVLSVAVTFDAAAANITTSNRFWLKGGSVGLNAEMKKGFGVSAGFTGLHTADSGGGVPVNIVVVAFGPSYTRYIHAGRQSVSLFAHGLVGDANGFDGLYPHAGTPTTHAVGLAARAGGGVDLDVARHFSLRLLEADWLRTQLPNATTNVQNDLRLGFGMVFHSATR